MFIFKTELTVVVWKVERNHQDVQYDGHSIHSHCLKQDIIPVTLTISVVGRDPRTPRPYLLSDGQNMYNRVVLVCTVNVYIPASLGRRPILRYQVLQVP